LHRPVELARVTGHWNWESTYQKLAHNRLLPLVVLPEIRKWYPPLCN
jgi:hypothetical protein